jgi:hypothetical protein
MQRVRIGVMGLAGVFLLVVLATALFSLFGEHGKVPSPGSSASAEANSADAPKEPLAELGVAPGNAQPETNSSAPSAAVKAAPSRSR